MWNIIVINLIFLTNLLSDFRIKMFLEQVLRQWLAFHYNHKVQMLGN